MVEITDQKSARAWLEGKPREVQVAFAARAALRALPGIATDDAATLNQIALPVLRAILTSSVATSRPTDDVKTAARSASSSASDSAASASAFSAAFSAFSASSSASDSAAFSADSASSAARSASSSASDSAARSASSSARSAAWAAADRDADNLGAQESPDLVFHYTLWPEAALPEGLDGALAELQGFWAENQQTWDFWARWYAGMLAGAPLPWDLQEAVALIPDEDWEAGLERVAERIRGIEFDLRTRVDRQVVYDDAAEVLRLETDPPPPAESLSFACNRVTLALDSALASGPANGLKEDSYETITIRSAVVQHPDDASVIAVSFYDTCMSFERRIGETYPDDTSLINLKNALWTTVEEITELDESAKARVQRYVQLGMSPPLTADEKDAIPGMIEEVKPFVDEELDARLRETGDLLRTAQEPPRSARARFANWMTTIVTWVDRTRKGEGRMTWLVKQIERMRKWFPGDGGPPDV